MKEFVTKYQEIKVQTSRKKKIDTMFMESESLPRQRYHNSRSRRDSVTRRQDSRGWDYFRIYDRSQSQNCLEFLGDAHSLPRSRYGNF